ncbi:hypothetical protein JHK82_042522 [Glycine max]|nr:hypothetical protein JHK85_043183 [Glycine max]KAG5105552.1 hypothetical protein JHK82_042522 [Glycine max]KAG5116662.1 hypothetical protein JHK84_042775 [Glycine max]
MVHPLRHDGRRPQPRSSVFHGLVVSHALNGDEEAAKRVGCRATTGSRDFVGIDKISQRVFEQTRKENSTNILKLEVEALSDSSKISLKLGKVEENGIEKEFDPRKKAAVLILGAGLVCQPVAEMLSSFGRPSSSQFDGSCQFV